MLSTLAILAAGCLIDGAIVAVIAYLTDGRRAARPLYGAFRRVASQLPFEENVRQPRGVTRLFGRPSFGRAMRSGG
jgi:hypothetical protein